MNNVSEEEIIIDALSKLKALESKLKKLKQEKSHTLNIFEAVGMTTQEIKHSAFLAWLLDPAMPHNLGNKFLRVFLENLLNYEKDNNVPDNYLTNKKILSSIQIETIEDLNNILNDSKLSVITERILALDGDDGRIDIFIESEKSKTLIAIENKVFTSTHDNQLNRYVSEFASRVDWKKIFIYLTPNGDLPYDIKNIYDKRWCILSYETILDTVRTTLQEVHNSKVKNLMEDYIEMVDTNILNKNPDLRRLCKKIKKKHADALKILNEYTDNAEDVVKYAFDWCKQHISNIRQMRESNSTFDFCTDKFEKFFVEHNQQIANCKNRLTLKCTCGYSETVVLGISLQKESNEIWHTAETLIIDNFSPNKTNLNNFITLKNYAVILISANERDTDLENLKSQLDIKLNEFYTKLLDFEAKLSDL